MAEDNKKPGPKKYSLYQGRNVRVGYFDSIAEAGERARSASKSMKLGSPDFRIVDSATKKTISKLDATSGTPYVKPKPASGGGIGRGGARIEGLRGMGGGGGGGEGGILRKKVR